MLVMPGGADLPYCKHLDGKGNSIIRRYVQSGGSYLGLCAGAYYACSRAEFEAGTALEVIGDRELGFFPGIARGATYPGFDYMTEAGAVAAHIQFQVPAALTDQAPKMQQDLHQQQAAMGCGQQQGSPHQGVGSGAMDLQQACHGPPLWCTTRDYCNGGPIFISKGGGLDISAVPGVEVLATYSQLPPRSIVPSSATVQEGIQPAQQEHKQIVHRLGQHGGGSRPKQTNTSVGGGRFAQCATNLPVQPAAAVRCQVGQGVAVLCGTHPELEPHWLDACGRSQEQVPSAAGPGTAGAGVDEHVHGPSTDDQEGATAPTTLRAPEAPLGAVLRYLTPADSGATVTVSGLQVPAVSQHHIGSTRGRQCQGLQIRGGVGRGIATGCGEGSPASTNHQMQCDNAALQAHTAHLKLTLLAYQQQRNMFLSCLLYEALSSVNKPGTPLDKTRQH